MHPIVNRVKDADAARQVIQDELEPLITRCPNCGTRFRVTESQLAVAAGRVRCGACLTVFEGTEHLLIGEETIRREENAGAALDELLEELSESDRNEDSVGGPGTAIGATGEPLGAVSELDAAPQIYGGFEEDEPTGWPEEARPEVDAEVSAPAREGDEREGDALGAALVEESNARGGIDGTVDEDADAVAAEEDEPLLELQAAEEPPGELTNVPSAAISFAPEPRRWWVGAVAGVFVLALIAQVFYFQLPDWSRDPGLRPIYETACRWLACELPAMRDVNRMSARNLVVRSHPELDGALIVDAVIVNDAEYAQPFPDLELRFTAVGGLLVAGRRFAPEEYLVGDEVDRTSMPPSTPVQVSLEIEDPGPDAVNYVLKFR